MEPLPSNWKMQEGDGPLIALAIHDGHMLRPEVAVATKLSDADRLREEDPFTGLLARPAPTHIIPQRSRFEVDLNRPPESAVYVGPEQAWGLDVWHQPLKPDVLARSKAYYDDFYTLYRSQLERLLEHHKSVLVLDLHSFNHRRGGPDAPMDDPVANPEVNLGTGTVDKARFGSVVELFLEEMSRVDFNGSPLDVRENVKFKGGYVSRWTLATFPGRACVLSVEFKKIFMDEWSGTLHEQHHGLLHEALWSTIPALLNALP